MPWGEITVTPLDYNIISGLSFTNQLVPDNPGLTPKNTMVIDLLDLIYGSLGPKEYISRYYLAKGLCLPDTSDPHKICAFEYLLFLASPHPGALAFSVMASWRDRRTIV